MSFEKFLADNSGRNYKIVSLFFRSPIIEKDGLDPVITDYG